MMGMTLSPITARRVQRFRRNRRAYWSLWLFVALFIFTLFAELVTNDRPFLIYYDGDVYFPMMKAYPETDFGGEFKTEAVYSDPVVRELINEKGWMLDPILPYNYDTLVLGREQPAPAPPNAQNWLGTDDQSRDVFARVVYGYRISILFGLALTLVSSAIGIAAGLLQGYFGGLTDLLGQRFIEIWTSLPSLFVLMILSSVIAPNFWWLLIILVLFSWPALTDLVRAEVLRARNFEYVRAAQALGVVDRTIMWRHVLPNAMVATVTFMPFIAQGSIIALTSLDFLGFGMPPGSPSLGELLQQGRNNLQAPWLTFTAFATVAVMLSLLVFVGEGVRDAFDPRKASEDVR